MSILGRVPFACDYGIIKYTVAYIWMKALRKFDMLSFRSFTIPLFLAATLTISACHG